MDKTEILIIGTNADRSTKRVCSWLDFYKKKYVVLDFKSVLESVEIASDLTNADISNFKVAWYRRDIDYIKFYQNVLPLEDTNSWYLLDRCLKDIEILKHLFLSENPGMKWLSSHLVKKINKLEMLTIAESCGFKIPETIITNSKHKLSEFINRYKHVICKPISEIYSHVEESTNNILNQKVVEILSTKNFPDFFFPSIFQEKISKRFEIRTFVIGDKVFGGIILDNEKVDIREVMNSSRVVPYNFEDDELLTIQKFMKKLNCNMGSIDLLKDKNGELVFIELNPMGQYDLISNRCNFDLDKEIAEYLISQI